MKKILVLVLLTTITSVFLFAQRPRPGREPIGKISGRFVDDDDQRPLEYVNVILYSLRDSSMVTGTITGPEGNFVIDKVPFGRFYLTGNFIGYNRTVIENIMIKPGSITHDIGEVTLKAAAVDIEGVEITGERPRIEYKLDKKVVNVGQDLNAAGGSAVDVLENTPSVEVDIEGNVSLRGSSNFTVLIDGKPSVLEGSDALQQLPASMIQSIEIITNPSAKYDPDGMAGIINVVMKKKMQQGFNGVINASVGTGNKYKFDFLLNYRLGKFNFFGGLDFNDRNFTGDSKSELTTELMDTSFVKISDGEREMYREGFRARGGFDYYIDDRNTLTLSGNLGRYTFGRSSISKIQNHEFFDGEELSGIYSFTDQRSERERNFYSADLNYQHTFDDNGHKLDVNGFYSESTGDDFEDQISFLADELFETSFGDPSIITTREEDGSDELRVKADYTLPLSEESRFEAGLQARLENENEDYFYNEYDTVTGGSLDDPQYDNKMDFMRDIYSAYTMFSDMQFGFRYQIGLRGEYTYRKVEHEKAPEAFTIDRMDYYPSIHISRELPKDFQAQASYSRRIDRPRSWYLDPFRSYMDPYTVREGNPDLQPEYIDSYEIGIQKNINASFVSLEGYHRVTNNKIERIQTVLDQNTFLLSIDNLSRDFSTGAELMINYKHKKWLTVNTSVNYYHYKLEGTVNDADIDQENDQWNNRTGITIRTKSDTRFQLNTFYSGPSVTAQGERGDFFFSNFAVRQDFLDRSLSLTLRIRDIFGTAKHEFTSSGENFRSYFEFNRESPVVSVSATYRINNYKSRERRQQEEMEMEMEDGF